MIELLNLVFHSFWTFIGTLMLIGFVGRGVAHITCAFNRVPPKPLVYFETVRR